MISQRTPGRPFPYASIALGLLVLSLVFMIEFQTGVSGTVGYVVGVLIILWFSWNKRFIGLLGIVSTAFMVAGFIVIDENTVAGIAVNRALGVVTIWLLIIFANRYRKLYNDELVQKHQLRSLFENATEGMLFTNSTGEIVRINRAAVEMFGYQAGELLGKRIESLVPQRFAEKHLHDRNALYQHPAHRPKGPGSEFPGRRKDGSEFFVEISLSHFQENGETFFIAFIVDISERKRQQQIIQNNLENIKRLNEELDAKVRKRTAELQQAMVGLEYANAELVSEISERKKMAMRLLKSQQLYAAVARNFPDGVVAVLNKEMRYILADGQELDKICPDKQAVIGQRMFDGMSPALTARVESMMKPVFAGENASFEVDVNENIYHLTAVPLSDGRGTIHEVLIVMTNVTDRKTVERKLLKAIEKEKELNMLKSRFVTMASHEFRTPLSTMLSSVFLLENQSGEQFAAQKAVHLGRIRRSIQLLTELMNDFLSLGKLEEGRITATYTALDIKVFLEELVGELRSIKKQAQTINFRFTGETLTLMTDRQILSNMLRNLVSNAVKYSPDESEIAVEAEVAQGNLVISVIDHGMGIPEHEQAGIFKRFFRAENASNIQGTGLGLNIVRKYVNLLRGKVSFTSKVGQGSTFTLRIPAIIYENVET